MEETTAPSTSNRSWWRLPLLLAVVLAAIVMVRARGLRETESVDENPTRKPPVSGETVSLVVDFGDDRQEKYDAVPLHVGMTVRDLLMAVGASEKTHLQFAQQGSGQTAFLTKINNVENEGAGGRNWTYHVNDTLGDRSFAIYELRPGDHVLWTFATEQ